MRRMRYREVHLESLVPRCRSFDSRKKRKGGSADPPARKTCYGVPICSTNAPAMAAYPIAFG